MEDAIVRWTACLAVCWSFVMAKLSVKICAPNSWTSCSSQVLREEGDSECVLKATPGQPALTDRINQPSGRGAIEQSSSTPISTGNSTPHSSIGQSWTALDWISMDAL